LSSSKEAIRFLQFCAKTSSITSTLSREDHKFLANRFISSTEDIDLTSFIISVLDNIFFTLDRSSTLDLARSSNQNFSIFVPAFPHCFKMFWIEVRFSSVVVSIPIVVFIRLPPVSIRTSFEIAFCTISNLQASIKDQIDLALSCVAHNIFIAKFSATEVDTFALVLKIV
jgi:formyltetrahydrofolate hydrolase